jgi:hypothetical protein
MQTVKCPACAAELELPPGHTGGRVVCPYCEKEFAPGIAPGVAPVRGGASRRRPARRRAAEDDYDEDRSRRSYGRKMDPTPIILAVVALVIIAGGAAFFLMKGKEREGRLEHERVQRMGTKLPAYFPPPNPMQPQGNAYEFFCDYQKDDKITFRKMDYNAQVTYTDNTGAERTDYSETYSIRGDITNETIVAREGDIATHEGTYQIKSYMLGTRNLVPDPVALKARFKTDRRGAALPGSFERLDGAELPQYPALLPERGFGIVDLRAHRQGDRWGLDALREKVYDQVDVPGVDLRSIPLVDGGRQGGWYIQGGNPVKTSRGNWEKRTAHLKLAIHAVENRRQQNGRFRGLPADISVAVRWQGSAMYELGKRMISHVQGLSINLEVVVKTRDGWYHWISSEHIDAEILKDS